MIELSYSVQNLESADISCSDFAYFNRYGINIGYKFKI